MAKQPCVYILASGRRGYMYIGVTSNLPQRIYQHKNGTVEDFATHRDCTRLVRYEIFDEIHGAMSREKQLKKWPRDWQFNLIESENADWIDLAPGLGLRA
ncbi:MAG: GIY-YIG nuclease family protein [Parasphingorhabdus sp.]